MTPHELLEGCYRSLVGTLSAVSGAAAWAPTRCAGWCVQDLTHHLLSDAQRALVALHTPAQGPPDTDAVSYWQSWQPEPQQDDRDLRATRTMASAWTYAGLLSHYDATVRAAVTASAERSGEEVVGTQGHRLTVDALRSTLAVEATVHQLDLDAVPTPRGLAEVRRVLDGLLGRPLPIEDATRCVLVGTGREQPTVDEAAALGPDLARLPLFG